MARLQRLYLDAIAKGQLQPDPAQQVVIQNLDDLLLSIQRDRKKNLLSILRKKQPIQGVYLYGSVGRGKTMLMDFFLHELQKEQIQTERWHFHAFMLEVHRTLHDLTLEEHQVETRVQRLADQWADHLDVLCFDEFHVTDVADAMIMMPLFSRLFARGVIVVATSNWPPDDLYAGGLQRKRFLPFIAILKKHMRIVHIGGDLDYRTVQPTKSSWLFPLNLDTQEQLDIRFRDAAGYDPIETHEIQIGSSKDGRRWVIPRASKDMAWLDMAQMLSQPLGAADFLALAARYKTIFLDNLSPFGSEDNERAKRFMVMIDALYDSKIRLVVRADTPAEQLYPEKGRLAFEFSRTLSRLKEMTPDYEK